MPASTIVSNASSTPALTKATISNPLSKNSWSVIGASVTFVFSNAVSPVALRHVNKCLSSLAQSSIIVDKNTPLIISSWCFLNKGLQIFFSTGSFRCYHYYSNVFSYLGSFFHNIKSVRVGECCTFFHQRHNRFDNGSMLFVRS